MSGSFDDQGNLEIGDGRLVCCFGKKGSGKSILALMLFLSYPGDKLVIDVARDDGPMGPDVVTLQGSVDTLPASWPEDQRKFDQDGRPLPMTVRFLPDGGSATFLEDCDHVLGLAYAHSEREKAAGRIGVCALVHEIGRVAPANMRMPSLSRIFDHSRHAKFSLIMCGPRSKTIDPRVIQQADVVYVFELQSAADRLRISENIGWDRRAFDEDVEELKAHEYLRYDAREPKPDGDEQDMRLTSWPALPEDVVKETRRRAGLV